MFFVFKFFKPKIFVNEFFVFMFLVFVPSSQVVVFVLKVMFPGA